MTELNTSPDARLQLEELLVELELDVQLATTREQLIRANQRKLKLKRILEL